MIRKTSELSGNEIYKILIGTVVPRPIAWVSTLSAANELNLAPFSFFTVASSSPPVVCFAPALKGETVDGEGVPKDTLRNITETGEFVVNLVSFGLVEKMNQTSAPYAHGINEFEKAGLQAETSVTVRPPRIKESLVSMECRLRQVIAFGIHAGAGNLVLGDVQCFHIADSIVDPRLHIDIHKLNPVARLAGTSYTKLGEVFNLERPSAE